MIIQWVNSFNMKMIFVMSDMVPALIYYHGAAIIRVLHNQIRNDQLTQNNLPENTQEKRFHLVWFHFEEVLQLVYRINKLFGMPIATMQVLTLVWLTHYQRGYSASSAIERQ